MISSFSAGAGMFGGRHSTRCCWLFVLPAQRTELVDDMPWRWPTHTISVRNSQIAGMHMYEPVCAGVAFAACNFLGDPLIGYFASLLKHNEIDVLDDWLDLLMDTVCSIRKTLCSIMRFKTRGPISTSWGMSSSLSSSSMRKCAS